MSIKGRTRKTCERCGAHRYPHPSDPCMLAGVHFLCNGCEGDYVKWRDKRGGGWVSSFLKAKKRR